jgi:hypothetical protein
LKEDGMADAPKSVERWERIRRRGRRSFVWRWGVLAWGLPTGVLFSVMMIVQPDESIGSAMGTAAVALVVFPLGGLVWGNLMWFVLNLFVRSASGRQG